MFYCQLFPVYKQKMKFIKIAYFLAVVLFLLTACHSSKNVVYVQNAGVPIDLSKSILPSLPELVVKNGDMLMITVSTISPEASVPFNPPLISDPNRIAAAVSSTTSTPTPLSYLVDDRGYISFPVIGKVFVAGLSRIQIEELIKSSIYPRFLKEDPIITVRLTNYRISVLGEVSRPGVITTTNDRISIFEALALSGDMTIYGQRENVLLIREDMKGKRETYRVDLRDKNLIQSPYFYLQQNDVVYVQPNNVKTKSSAIGTGEYLIFSVIGSLISVTSLLISILR